MIPPKPTFQNLRALCKQLDKLQRKIEKSDDPAKTRKLEAEYEEVQMKIKQMSRVIAIMSRY